jgi:hypothetical protein
MLGVIGNLKRFEMRSMNWISKTSPFRQQRAMFSRSCQMIASRGLSKIASKGGLLISRLLDCKRALQSMDNSSLVLFVALCATRPSG